MYISRPLVARAAGVFCVGLLLALPGGAAVTPATSAPASATAPAPAPLTRSEAETLQALYPKVRPATLRIEQCVAANTCAQPEGVGTAVFIGGGLALTAYHVVFQAAHLSAVNSSNARFSAQVLGYDDQHDLALLRVNLPKGTPAVPLATRLPKVGDAVLAVGNGGGAFLRPKTGRLLALNARASRADFPPGTLETSAPLIPGDSGGPLLNAAGQLTGIVSFIRARQTESGSVTDITAYAVPVTAGMPLLDDLKSGVRRDAPVIGIALNGHFALLSTLPPAYFAETSRQLGLGLGTVAGAFFTSVAPGSPAAKAGLQALAFDRAGRRIRGDLVTAVNGERVLNFSQFQYAVRRHSPGETITLSVLRGKQPLRLKVKLEGRAALRN